MSDDSDVTVGELFRALGKVEKAVDDGFTKVNGRIDALRSEFVLKELYESEMTTLRASIKDSTVSRRYWLATLLPASVSVAALLTAILH